MYTRAEAKGLKHMTGFTWRFTPLAMMMRELVQEGLLGKVFHVTACTLLGFRGYPAHSRTVITPVGGILAMAGSHLIDLTMSFVGPIGAVCGHAAQHITEPPLWVESHGQTRRAERDDSTIFLAKFRNAAQGVFHTSAVATSRPASGLICIEIHGDEGGLIHELELTPGGTSCVWASTIEEDGFTPVPLPDAVRSA
jgi:predicted dehydrogenase